MYRDRDLEAVEGQIPNGADLTQDLELNTLLLAMAQGDEFLCDVARKAVPASLYEPEAILYRQEILLDCQQQPEIVRELYAISVESVEREKKVWGGVQISTRRARYTARSRCSRSSWSRLSGSPCSG